MSYYVTTPIYYVNDKPHIGHAYTTVLSDILFRYHKLFEEESFFLTGTDEHGQKIQSTAEKNGITPLEQADKTVLRFQKAWEDLNIKPSFFIRTTMDFHKTFVQECLQDLWDKGEIYSQEYEGLYCVSEEIFYTPKDLVDGKTPQGNTVEKVKETNYFFKMSKYQNQLIDYINKHPDFICPEFRKNEVLGFLKQPLNDLCISRPKSRLRWGIELPFDKDFVTYVWFDALLNYISGVGGYKESKKFDIYWSEVIHLIGKDILITHCVYWPTMLMALGLSLPKKIFAHGWWLMENEKMSKSKGNFVDPLDIKDTVGVDGLRYFLARDIYLGNDAHFSPELVISRINAELANNLGNLFSRTSNLINKYFEGKCPQVSDLSENSQKLQSQALETADKVKAEILKMAPNLAIGHIMDLLTATNTYLEREAPWKKTDKLETAESLYCAVEVIRIATTLLSPVIPEKSKQLLQRLSLEKPQSFENAKAWDILTPEHTITKGEPLFPRVDKKHQ